MNDDTINLNHCFCIDKHEGHMSQVHNLYIRSNHRRLLNIEMLYSELNPLNQILLEPTIFHLSLFVLSLEALL